jgi:hypothetical protein
MITADAIKKMAIGDAKVYEPDFYQETELPYSVLWDEVVDRPETLAQLDPTAQESIDTINVDISDIEAEFDTLGDLAFEDLVDTLQLSNNAVTNAKIAVGAIQGAVIAAGAITETKIDDDAISTPKLQAGAITAAKIDTGAVTATKIASGAVTTVKLDAEAVTAAKIAAGTITSNEINVSSIQAAVVTASAINALTITAITITGGSITGVTLTGGTVRTSSGSDRVQMNGSNNYLEFYRSGVLRANIRGTTVGAGGLILDTGDFYVQNDRGYFIGDSVGWNAGISVTSADQFWLILGDADQFFIKSNDGSDNLFTVSQTRAYVNGRLQLESFTTNSSTVGDLWYYDNGAEGLRMRISGGFTLQFQADIV